MAYDSIKAFEGFRDRAYRDANGQWAVGYGQSVIGGRPVKAGDILSREQADMGWAQQVAPYAAAVKAGVKVPLSAGQDEALTSFVYNHGPKSPRVKTLLAAVNSGDAKAISAAFRAGNTSEGKVNPALARRRELELSMYFGTGGGTATGGTVAGDSDVAGDSETAGSEGSADESEEGSQESGGNRQKTWAEHFLETVNPATNAEASEETVAPAPDIWGQYLAVLNHGRKSQPRGRLAAKMAEV